MGSHRVGHDWSDLAAAAAEGGTEKAVVPHSSTLAWKIPWTEEPGTLQSTGSHRVGHDWNDLAAAAAAAAAAGRMGWGVSGGRFKKTYMYLWLIHIVVWQKLTQYCKAITLQLNNKFFQKKKKNVSWKQGRQIQKAREGIPLRVLNTWSGRCYRALDKKHWGRHF